MAVQATGGRVGVKPPQDTRIDAETERGEAERAHYEAIVAEHPNFVALSQEPAFADFVALVDARAVVDHGDATDINTLLTAYVAFKAPPAQRRMNSPVKRVRAPLSPRQERALRALLSGPHRREQLDRAAGASNSPDLIKNMRERFGLDLTCEMVPSVDRDRQHVKVGLYSLSDLDRRKVLALLAEQDQGGQAQSEEPDTLVSWVKSIPRRALESLITLPRADGPGPGKELLENPFFLAALPA
jgi:hypothetical protein